MNDKIITVEEAVKEMMNGEIVRMPKDEGTFFAYHEANNLIYMIHYDSLTNRMSISPIDSPSNIKNGKNTFLQGKKDDVYSIINFNNKKFEESTFKDFFNSLRVNKDTSKSTKEFVISCFNNSIESKMSNAVSFNEAIQCLLKGKIAVTCGNDNKLCFLMYHEIEKKIYFIYPVFFPSSLFVLDALFSEDELCNDKFIKISEEYTFTKRNEKIFKIYDSFEDFIYKDCIFEVYMNKTTQYPKTILQKEVMNTMVDNPYSDNWKEFKNSGLLWFVNSILHVFGWNIVLEMENGKVLKAYPQRTKYRGFSEKSNTKGYINLSQYIKDHADELLKEAKDE